MKTNYTKVIWKEYIMKEEVRTRKRHPIGSPPGTLMPRGTVRTEPVEMHVLSYDKDSIQQHSSVGIDMLEHHLKDPRMTWVTVTGVHDSALNRRIGEVASVHSLFLEDIMNMMIRPKIEIMDSQMLVIMKTADYIKETREIIMRQVSIIIGPRYVITFLEEPMDILDPLVKRIYAKGNLIRTKGSDFLAYAVMDILIDRYYTILDDLGEESEILESSIFDAPDERHSLNIHRIRNHLITLRKTVWPIREIIRAVMREEFIDSGSRIYYSDIYDHVIQIMDHVDTLRDIVSGLMDIYMSSISNRMNEVMKVLTVIATIFIPLTFIVGIYGMNFINMPELEWRWGYFAVLGIMAAVAVFMVAYFRRKRWI